MKIRGNTIGTTIKPEKNLVKATDLTPEEQEQARANIGALAVEYAVKSVNEVTPDPETGNVTIPTGITKTILWENASPVSVFNTQTIIPPEKKMANFDEIEIEFIVVSNNNNFTLTRSTITPGSSEMKSQGIAFGSTSSPTSGTTTIATRLFMCQYNTGGRIATIRFDAGYQGASIKNTAMIPYRIYGIKGVEV